MVGLIYSIHKFALYNLWAKFSSEELTSSPTQANSQEAKNTSTSSSEDPMSKGTWQRHPPEAPINPVKVISQINKIPPFKSARHITRQWFAPPSLLLQQRFAKTVNPKSRNQTRKLWALPLASHSRKEAFQILKLARKEVATKIARKKLNRSSVSAFSCIHWRMKSSFENDLVSWSSPPLLSSLLNAENSSSLHQVDAEDEANHRLLVSLFQLSVTPSPPHPSSVWVWTFSSPFPSPTLGGDSTSSSARSGDARRATRVGACFCRIPLFFLFFPCFTSRRHRRHPLLQESWRGHSKWCQRSSLPSNLIL